MKIIFRFEKSELLGEKCVILRWDAEIEPEDLVGVTIEQIKQEVDICLNEQYGTQKVW